MEAATSAESPPSDTGHQKAVVTRRVRRVRYQLIEGSSDGVVGSVSIADPLSELSVRHGRDLHKIVDGLQHGAETDLTGLQFRDHPSVVLS